MDKTTNLTREQLYERVWAMPATKLAREFGFSDVALAKLCKKHRIPKPPLGYWARIQHGQQIKRPKLPTVNNPRLETITVSPHERQDFTLEPHVRELSDRATETEIQIPDKPGRLHPIVRRTKLALKDRKYLDTYGLASPTVEGCLDVRVSPKNIGRAIKIMNALIKALEKMGYLLTSQKGSSKPLYINILGENLKIILREEINRKERDLTREEKEALELNPMAHMFGRYTYHASGKLMLKAETEFHSTGCKRTWLETTEQPLEKCLSQFVGGLIKLSQKNKMSRLRHEEFNRKMQEEKNAAEAEHRRRYKENQKARLLNEQIKQWDYAKSIEKYVAEVKEQREHAGEWNDSGKVEKWLLWAKSYAASVKSNITVPDDDDLLSS